MYSTLLRPKREEYHERIGAAVETLYTERLDEYYELLAYHYTRSANTDKAVEYLDLANQRAAKTNAMAGSHAYFAEAMRLLDPPHDRAQPAAAHCPASEPAHGDGTSAKFPEYYELLSCYEPIAAGLGHPGLWGHSMPVWDGASGVLAPSIRLS